MESLRLVRTYGNKNIFLIDLTKILKIYLEVFYRSSDDDDPTIKDVFKLIFYMPNNIEQSISYYDEKSAKKELESIQDDLNKYYNKQKI